MGSKAATSVSTITCRRFRLSLATRRAWLALLALAVWAQASHVWAIDLIVNGGFEAGGGSFVPGWTVVNQAGGSGNWFIQSGATGPMGGFPVPTPPGPTHAAMTDQGGPGCHILYQDLVIPTGVTSATLTFKRFNGNRGIAFTAPFALDYTLPSNQQSRVDFITTSANPFSILAADVLLNVYQTLSSDPKVDPAYITQVTDVTAFLASRGGQTLRLRFAECDNGGNYQFGIDDISLIINSSGGVPSAGPEGSYANGSGTPGIEGTFGFGGRNSHAVASSTAAALVGPFAGPAFHSTVFHVSRGNVASPYLQTGSTAGDAPPLALTTCLALALLSAVVFAKSTCLRPLPNSGQEN